jgi:hypothetical protein
MLRGEMPANLYSMEVSVRRSTVGTSRSATGISRGSAQREEPHGAANRNRRIVLHQPRAATGAARRRARNGVDAR